MEKAKTSAARRRLLHGIAGGVRLRMLARELRRGGDGAVAFPVDPLSVRQALVVMPEDPLEMLHSLTMTLSLLPRLSRARILCACEKTAAPFLGGLGGSVRMVVYNREDRYLLSPAMERMCGELFRERFDCCLLLERQKQEALSYLLGRTGARIRVGFADAAPFPFCNVRVRCTDRGRYRADQYGAIAGVFGVTPRAHGRWAISEKARTEVALMLKERGVAPGAVLVGIDGEMLIRRCGRRWTAGLVGAVLGRTGRTLYVYAPEGTEADRQWWAEAGIPLVVGSMGVSHLAALVERSACVVAARSLLFELAHLLQTESVGLFDNEELAVYCGPEPYLHGIAFDGQPDASAAEQAAAMVGAICARASNGVR